MPHAHVGSRLRIYSIRRYCLLAAWRINQNSAYMSVLVGLKRDPQRKFRYEKVLLAFRAEMKFWETPSRRQLDGQEVTLPDDPEYALALRFIPTGKRIDRSRANRDSAMFCRPQFR